MAAPEWPDRGQHRPGVDGDAGPVIATILEALPLPVIIVDTVERLIVDANTAACRLFGMASHDMVGLSIDAVTADGSRRVVTELLRSQPTAIAEKRFVHADGRTLHARVHAAPFGAGGRLVAAMISDRSESIAARHRLDLLDIIGQVGARPVAGPDDAEVHISEIERAFAALLGWSVRVHLGADAAAFVGGTTDLGTAGATRIEQPISVGAHVIGWLVVEAPADRLVPTDAAFVATAARSLAMLGLVGDLRRELSVATFFEAGFEATHIGMQVVDLSGTYLRVNRAFAAMLGYQTGDLIGRNWREFTAHEFVSDESLLSRREALDDLGYADQLKRYRHADGRDVWARISVSVVDESISPIDAAVHLVHVIDVTSEFIAREALEESERRFRSLVQPSADLIMRARVDLVVVDANDRAIVAFGGSADEVIGRNLRDSLPDGLGERLAAHVADAVSERRTAEMWREWIDPIEGESGWYVLRILPEEPGPSDEVEHVHIVATEISELVESEQRLSSMALVDPLTKVTNRAAIFDRLQHALDRLDRGAYSGVAVALLDLDHFKSLNDAFGHVAGDEVLRVAATALSGCVRVQDTVGRLGGDEFIVIFEDVPDRPTARRLAQRLHDALGATRAAVSRDVDVDLSASMGVSWTGTAAIAQDLVARADRAMYEAKRHGRGRLWLERTTGDARPESTSELLRQLSRALEHDQFRLHFQPIVDVETGRVSSAEALIRWQHPDGGLLTANRFLGQLLESGHIGSVGRWVVRSTIEQLAEWDRTGVAAPDRIHFNVTPAELADPRLPDLISEHTEAYGVDPARLCLELTEQALVGTVVSTSVLAALRELGLTVMLDDFGTGVSSLTHLRSRQLGGIKIDRSFVRGATVGTRERSIVEGLFDLAARMEVEVVAEGVEREDQMLWLRDCGCQLAQGWYCGRPMRPDDLTDWMATRSD